jgi:hypothetical protein
MFHVEHFYVSRAGSLGFHVQGLHQIGRLELPSCAVTDVEHYNLFLSLQNAVYHAIDVWLVAVQ